MSKRTNERYKVIASAHGSAAAATAAVGFIRPEIENRNSPDPNTIYEPYIYLLVALILLAFGVAWLQGHEE